MKQKGFTLTTVLMLSTVIIFIVATVSTILIFDLKGSASLRASTTGFYSAEAGLNLRANSLREVFVGYNVPQGEPPTVNEPCVGLNQGTFDFRCQIYNLNGRRILTYVRPDPNNPRLITIPRGELYQGLSAQEYTYTVFSQAFNQESGMLEAHLELKLRSRLVPLFQFAAFYNKDLEILPGPNMLLSGPVHTNGNLYLDSNTHLSIQGQVTTARNLYRGRKNANICRSNSVSVSDPLNLRPVLPTCSTRTLITNDQLAEWNGMIQTNVDNLTVPDPGMLSPSANSIYWQRADLRLVYNFFSNAVEILDQNRQVMQSMNNIFRSNSTCSNAVRIRTFNNRRERQIPDTTTVPPAMNTNILGRQITLMDVDLRGLLTCLHQTNWLNTGKQLNDNSDGGLVFFFTVFGPNSDPLDSNGNGLPDEPSPFGVRLRNGESISASVAGAPRPLGVTIVSDQAVYIWGNFNGSFDPNWNQWIPAAILADSINVLSNNWSEGKDTLPLNSCDLSSRIASNTVIQAAFLAGTDVSGLVEGENGHDINIYNGGLENYPRFHEDWQGKTLVYRGSFISLNRPLKVRGFWASQCYWPPTRDWNYDTRFNNAANLPPLTPRFVYQKQELYLRHF